MQNKIIRILKEYTHQDNIKLRSRGNTAIFSAFYCAKNLQMDKKIVLVPDQGGWFTHIKYPKILEMDVVLLKTDYGVIDLRDLEKKSKSSNCIMYSNPAGYFAEQPIKEIYDICKGNNCMVIMDVTGSVGTELGDGNYSDFCVGSFGRWKPVNLGYGGFISAKKKEFFEKSIKIFDSDKFEEKNYEGLYEKLKNIKERYRLFENIHQKIKKDLKAFEILHKEKRGINVIVKFNSQNEEAEIMNYCKKNNFEFTLCPRYIRVNETAVSIEVKRRE